MILVVGVTADEARLLGLSERTLIANLQDTPELERFLADQPQNWEAILLGPRLQDPLQAVQRIKAKFPEVVILILAQPAEAARLGHQLLLTPMRGETARTIVLDESAGALIERHLVQAKLRRRHGRAISEANRHVPARPEVAFHLPPVVARFFETTPGAVFLLDEESRVLHANRPARELLLPGLAAAHIADALPVGETDALRSILSRADPTETTRLTIAGPRTRAFDAIAARSSLIPRQQGTLLLLNDVTRLVEAEAERERQNSIYRTLVAAQSELGLGVMIIEHGRASYVNDALVKMTGYTLAELQAKGFFIMVAPEAVDKVKARQARRARGEPTEETYETVFLTKGGERLLIEASAKTFGGGSLTVIIMRDVTQRKQMMAELEATRAAIAQMDKLATMGSLVGGLAHEIRTPLTAILNHVALAEDATRRALQADEPRALLASVADNLGTATASIDRIRILVREMNQFLRGETPKKTLLVPNDTVAQAVGLFQSANHGRASIDLQLESSARIEADPAQLQQIVINLLQNAVDASPSGERVRVATKDTEDGVDLVIQDFGSGIPSDMQARMFEAFATTKTSGTGLGLTIVRRLAEIHHARIRFETADGKGTTFVVSFPRAG